MKLRSVGLEFLRGIKAAAWPSIRRPFRVIVFGVHSAGWMQALASDARVWAGLEGVEKVVLAPDAQALGQLADGAPSWNDLIIPLMEEHIRSCPRAYWGLFPSDCAVEILADKKRLASYVRDQGLAHLSPATYADAVDAVYPCVLKRVDLNSGNGVAVAISPDHLRDLLDRDIWRGRPFVLQELVMGNREYVAHCVCRDGRILWSRSYEYEMSESAAVRTPHNVKAMRPYALGRRQLGALEDFLAPLGYDGPANFDFKLIDTGSIRVLEVNPRLGGSLMNPKNVDDLRDALACIMENAKRPVPLPRQVDRLSENAAAEERV